MCRIIRRKATGILRINCVLGEDDFHPMCFIKCIKVKIKLHLMAARVQDEEPKETGLTSRIAGSSGIFGGLGGSFSVGPPSILRSFTSLPRKTMYS